MSSIRISWDHDADAYVDRYGRTAELCRTQATVAAALARTTRGIAEAIDSGAITLGREAGPKFVGRHHLNAVTFDAIAERDHEAAEALEQAEAAERQLRQEHGQP